ncbi:MAG: hypothetical protein ACTHK4_12925, partial [Mycobacteriales bacterium]
MTLWIAAAAVALLVIVVRPQTASRRLAGWSLGRHDGAPPARSIGPRELAMAVASGSALVALRLPLPVAMAGGVIPLGGAKLRALREADRVRQAREAAVVDATFALAGELRAGRTPSEALRAAAATAEALADVLRGAAEAVAIGGSAAV